MTDMKRRTVKVLQYADLMDMGGMPIRQPLPSVHLDQVDPFLLLHHHQGKVAKGAHPREVGVGPHPHRGFSPVTFILKGDVHHRDSRGNSAVVHAGGVQWMDAGMGIMHSERPSKELSTLGGDQEIVQLWVNTPSARKMDQPNYQALQETDIPEVKPDTGEGRIQVIAGTFKDAVGPAHTKLDLLILRADLEAGASQNFTVPATSNAIMYVVRGNGYLQDYGDVPALHMVAFKNDGDTISVEVHQPTTLLLLAGKPIDEPVTQYGPFVMTNQTEILHAMRDYQMGKMGILIEDFD